MKASRTMGCTVSKHYSSTMRRKATIFLALPAMVAANAKYWKIGEPCPTAIHGVSSRSFVPWDPDAPLDPANYWYSFRTMRDAYHALLSCPNINAIYIRVALQGCSDWPDRFNFPFNPLGGDRYLSAPEILSLEGYDGDEDSWGYKGAPEGAVQTNMTNIDLWLNAMDFSRIHTLAFPYSRNGYI